MTDQGRFVALEGIEGAGKTTQVTLLVEWLERLGIPCRSAREPGGTAVGEAIRDVVQDRPELEVPRETELLLYVAARAAFVQQVVRPALARGELVVADRYDLSTLAYQGFGRGLDLEVVRRINAFGTGGLRPDVYVYIDVPAEGGRARRLREGRSEDRMEGAGPEFLDRVRRGYLELVEEDPAALTVDGTGTAQEVSRRIREVLKIRFPETFADTEV